MSEALRLAFEELSEAGIDLKACGLLAVGHRVVHGGKDFYRPTLLDDAVIAELEKLSELAPLHNPPALQGIKVARKLLPDVAAYRGVRHGLLPRSAGGGRDLRDRPGVGRAMADPPVRISRHVAPIRQRAGRRIPGQPLGPLNQIVLHLGNGASASAIAGGRPVDTSMGLTPLEGLVMGTRSGDIDPGVVSYLWRARR